jgi:prepilin-type N-terminal cleavage/methylation domain-containing protein
MRRPNLVTRKNSLLASKCGFTLLEIITVVAIIGILASIATVAYRNYISRTRVVSLETKYNELREVVGADLAKGEDYCSIQARLNKSDVIKDLSVQLSVITSAVDPGDLSKGYYPVLQVEASLASKSDGVKVALEFYKYMKKSDLAAAASDSLNKNAVSYRVILIAKNVASCGKVQVALTPTTSSPVVPVTTPPATIARVPAVTPASTTPPPSPTTVSVAATTPPKPTGSPQLKGNYKNMTEERRTYRMCLPVPGIPCEQLTEEVVCDENAPFAMNILHNNDDGSRTVDRKCATEDECHSEWWLGTSDVDKCRRFNDNSVMTLKFDCTWCCTGKNCNAGVKPPRNTYVMWNK